MSNVQYNVIYNKLVKSEDDLVGLIAYGIYKKHKIEVINRLKAEKGREPNDEECGVFISTSNTDSQLELYKNQAEAILSETVGNIAGEQINEIEERILRDYKANIKSCIPSNWKTFGISVAASAVSAILMSFGVALFYFLARTTNRETATFVDRVIESVQEKTAGEQCPVNTSD